MAWVQMEDERHPDEEEGARYKVIVEDDEAEIGEIVYLDFQDGSTCPIFRNEDNKEYCLWWRSVARLERPKKNVIGGKLI